MGDKFTKIEKDGKVIEVHEGTLKNHLELGWKEVVEAPKKEKAEKAKKKEKE